MKDNKIIEVIERTLLDKFKQNEKFIRYSFYELKVKENLSDEELDKLLELIKIKLEKQGYIVLFTGAKFIYQNCTRIVESNELMIAIKE